MSTAAQRDARTAGFQPTATTARGVMQEVFDYVVGLTQEDGLVPPSAGITKPRRAQTRNEFIASIQSVLDEQKVSKGGRATQMVDTPYQESYERRRLEFLRESEGYRTTVYEDTKGLKTIGIGFNLEAPGARTRFKDALGVSNEFLQQVEQKRRALTHDQVNRLFEASVAEAEGVVDQRLAGVALPEHRRLALVSMAFNSPALLGPNLTKQIKDGDWLAATDEILMRSNKEKSKGLAARRYREAEQFAGQDEASKARLPQYTSYMSQYE